MESIKLSSDKKTLFIDARINEVLNHTEFVKVTHEIIEIKANNLKGIVFHIKNKKNTNDCVLFQINDPHYIQLISQENNEILQWEIGDEVRVMYFNDTDSSNFNDAIPYFKERLTQFKYRKNVRPEEYKEFSERWNTNNPGARIDDYCNIDKFLQPKQTIKDDILTIV